MGRSQESVPCQKTRVAGHAEINHPALLSVAGKLGHQKQPGRTPAAPWNSGVTVPPTTTTANPAASREHYRCTHGAS